MSITARIGGWLKMWLLPFGILALCLFGPTQTMYGYGVIGTWVREIVLTFRDAETQWMVYACMAVYFVSFMVIGRRQAEQVGAHGVTCPTLRLSNADLWLSAGLVISAIAYAFNYTIASKSTEALMLLGGIVLGKGAVVWAGWGSEKAENRKLKAETERRMGTVLVILIVLLVAAALLKSETGLQFQYRGRDRWSGPWDNPNIFGMLMGVGVVLAVGRILLRGRNIQHSTSNIQHPISKWRLGRWVKIIFCLAAAGVMSVGLIKSYSRGAWVGAAAGLTYLGYQACNRQIRGIHEQEQVACVADVSLISHSSRFMRFLQRNWIPLASILVSLLVIAFWNYRHTERVIARRAFSMGNVNDFSWRNRVAAYQGALQMMADKPWLGFGWNQPEQVYDQYYRAPKLAEGAAIQMNDYFTLGTTLGIPALVCFVIYIGLSLTRNSERGVRSGQDGKSTSPRTLTPSPSPIGWAMVASDSPHGGEGDLSRVTRHLSPSVACRAGAIVLLVGFWFDGGLFKLATASVFWVLLELGKVD